MEWMLERFRNCNVAAKPNLHPWQLLMMCLAGWLQREQRQVIEFYQAQREALPQAQGKKRITLTDDQRRVLTVEGKGLGRKTLAELTTIVTPDTILRWHRKLVAQNGTITPPHESRSAQHSQRGPGTRASHRARKCCLGI